MLWWLCWRTGLMWKEADEMATKWGCLFDFTMYLCPDLRLVDAVVVVLKNWIDVERSRWDGNKVGCLFDFTMYLCPDLIKTSGCCGGCAEEKDWCGKKQMRSTMVVVLKNWIDVERSRWDGSKVGCLFDFTMCLCPDLIKTSGCYGGCAEELDWCGKKQMRWQQSGMLIWFHYVSVSWLN